MARQLRRQIEQSGQVSKGGPDAGRVIGRLGRACGRGRPIIWWPEECPAGHARAVPGAVGGRRAGLARRFRGDRPAPRLRRPAAYADDLLRAGRVLRPALGGQRAAGEPAPCAVPVVAASAVADGPGARAGATAGVGHTGANARTGAGPGARDLADTRDLARAGAYPEAGAHAAPGADLDAAPSERAVAVPVAAAAVGPGRRGLVPPLILGAGVAGSAFSPAVLVVTSGPI
jgi:hypothetical protein